ncbi:MAG TPA: thermosome subunit beta [Thermoplasmata archaeon]|nr:thermosome subunit beta [Thermoplasmata archaeon]
MMGGQPIIILKEGTEREKGKGAVTNNIAAARAVADAVKSTLGPKGMDKMLVDSLGDVTITNDGVTILKEIEIEHPTAKMLVEVAKTQDDEVGDGTTSAVILAGELLKEAEDLIEQEVHPTIIVNGYRMAATEAVRRLNALAFAVKRDDKTTLRSIARTAMSGRSVGAVNADFLADIAVDAVQSIIEEVAGEVRADVDNILVQKKHGGSLTDTTLIDGVVLDKERVHPRMPKFIRDAKIALINRALEVKKTEVNEEIRIRDPAKLQMFLNEEEKSLKTMVDKIKASGANVVLCQKGIDDVAQHYLAKEGIYAVRRVKESDMKKLAKATGARAVTNLDDLTAKELGKADLVEERKVGTDDMTFVTGNKKARAVSILIRGGTEHVVDEVERILHDALRVVAAAIEDGKAITGGGSAEIELSLALKDYAATVGGREQLAIEKFAHALEVIPRTLGENAGLDPIDVLIKLRAEHGKKGGKSMGVNVMSGEPLDMLKANVVEPLRVKTQEIESAAEVASMILRIDDIIASKKSPPPPPGGGEHGHGGGMGGMGGMPGMGM